MHDAELLGRDHQLGRDTPRSSLLLRILRIVATLALVLVVITTGASTASAAPWKPLTAAARAAAKEGAAAFNAKDYRTAAERYESSLSTERALLVAYNLAQTYRKLGEWKRAIPLYDSVLADKDLDAQDRPGIERARDVARMFDLAESYTAASRFDEARRYYLDLLKLRDLGDDDRNRATNALDELARIEAGAGTIKTREAPPASGENRKTSTASPQPLPNAPRPEGTPRWNRVGWLLGVGGLVAGGVGVGFLANASSLDDEANRQTTTSARVRLHDQASTRRTVGIVATVAGGATIAAALVTFALAPSSTRAPVTVLPGPGDAGLALAVDF